ncbi:MULTISPECIES: AAA family ATPase [Bradyrhizobium]|uniref:AAA family ATPase n=1 Tax=Bradyrhizobium elkanii TaxID=29448 RepID=UPI0012FD89B9|nr:AAA family ATPase [Bradyrhizobium elkanii]
MPHTYPSGAASAPRDEKTGRGFEFQLIENFSAGPAAKPWLIKNIIAKGETSAWIAPPGGMKSALLAELSICVARGVDWHGYRAKRAGSVLYFALERADLVRRRLRAHVERLGLEDALLNIAVVPSLVDLMNPAIVKKVSETLERAGHCFGGGAPDLVVFDTFAKAIAAGGGDEDKAQHQGRVFTHLAMIREEAMKLGAGGPHFAIVGHTGKDESRGARGSNAFRGDVDIEVAISGETIKTATVTKANDMPEGPLFSFTSEIHEFGRDEDGDPITVNIISTEHVVSEAQSRRIKWGKGLRLVRDAINAAVLEAGRDHHVGGTGPVVKATTVQAARAAHGQRYVSTGDGDRSEAERKAWTRSFKQARDLNLVGGEVANGDELIWLLS